ncbi:MAG TPA: hypothetical protein VMV82_00205 [Candidatus Dormibacteraeota bacterium]|nr:hypothetical protein [Candidatus Dormibacteraeota bacterium]
MRLALLSLPGIAAAFGFGDGLYLFSYSPFKWESALQLNQLELFDMLTLVLMWPLGLLLTGWITIPATVLLYGRLRLLAKHVCQGWNLLWSLPTHFVFGFILGVALTVLGIRLPAI